MFSEADFFSEHVEQATDADASLCQIGRIQGAIGAHGGAPKTGILGAVLWSLVDNNVPWLVQEGARN